MTESAVRSRVWPDERGIERCAIIRLARRRCRLRRCNQTTMAIDEPCGLTRVCEKGWLAPGGSASRACATWRPPRPVLGEIASRFVVATAGRVAHASWPVAACRPSKSADTTHGAVAVRDQFVCRLRKKTSGTRGPPLFVQPCHSVGSVGCLVDALA